MGGIWKHIPSLHDLAQAIAHNDAMQTILDEYWKKHSSPGSGSAAQQKPRVTSQRAASLEYKLVRNLDDHALLRHPVLALKHLLQLFGPLTFPLQRAALLRKRILLLGHPPVHEMCQFGMSSRYSELN